MSEPLTKYDLKVLAEFATYNITEAAHLKTRLRALLADREAMEGNIDQLYLDLDCGCGVSGCRNTQRQCARCQIEKLATEVSILELQRDEQTKELETLRQRVAELEGAKLKLPPEGKLYKRVMARSEQINAIIAKPETEC